MQQIYVALQSNPSSKSVKDGGCTPTLCQQTTIQFANLRRHHLMAKRLLAASATGGSHAIAQPGIDD